MKKEFRLLCALGMATMHTVAMANQSSYEDRQMASSDGRQWVERSVRLSDFEGGDVAVQVRLFKDGKGGFVYRYDDQNEATKLYHQAACEVMNSKVRRGETVISGESTVVGWSCEGDSDPAEDSNPASSDMTQPKAGYYVFALAPSGSAPIGDVAINASVRPWRRWAVRRLPLRERRAVGACSAGSSRSSSSSRRGP